MKIPYGLSNFRQIREEGFFYADKTTFLPLLESGEMGYRYLIFLRPRRFGKSTLLSMMEHYYDLSRKDEFDQLFGGLWVHEHPTPNRNRYLVLTLDFSGVSTDGDEAKLQQSFFDVVKNRVKDWVSAYRGRAPEIELLGEQINDYQGPEALLGGLLSAVRSTGCSLYLFIDEYDHFANRLLSAGGHAAYQAAIADRTGFVRTFYAALKTGTQSGAIARMFITGVSPLMLDDLSSGFNMASHVSQDPLLNALAGFTRADVERGVDELLVSLPEVSRVPGLSDRSELLTVLEDHYNGYCFSTDATERVFNSDMVLYFLAQIVRRKGYPADMLDLNVRTEYRHLQRIGSVSDTGSDARRALLSSILGEGYIETHLLKQFGVSSLSSDAPFLSFLYYLGMLTLGPRSPDRVTDRLEIPNRVIRELQWEHLALMFKEQVGVSLALSDLDETLHTMGVLGDIQPFLDLFHTRVLKTVGIKDTMQLGEKAVKLMLMTYLSLSRMFHVLSEKEFAQGYCDLFVGASLGVPGARYAWLLELKYLPAGAKAAQIEAAFAAAEEQVERYAGDASLLPMLLGHRQLKAGMLVFLGVKKVLFRPWPADGEQGQATKASKAGSSRGGKRHKAQAAKAQPGSKRRGGA